MSQQYLPGVPWKSCARWWNIVGGPIQTNWNHLYKSLHFWEENLLHIPDRRMFAWRSCSSHLAARPAPSWRPGWGSGGLVCRLRSSCKLRQRKTAVSFWRGGCPLCPMRGGPGCCTTHRTSAARTTPAASPLQRRSASARWGRHPPHGSSAASRG